MENQFNDRIKQDRQAVIQQKMFVFYEVVVLCQMSLLNCSWR